MTQAMKAAVLALVCVLLAAPVFGQGGTTSATLSGVVTDKDGLVPGATVVVTKMATGEKLPAQTTNASGAYSFPGLAAGKYKVTISMQGFKTTEIEATVTSGTANSLQTKLEVGAVSEVVNVTAGSDLVRTDTATLTQTVSANFIQTLPRADRNALNFLIFLPGVTTVGGAGSARNGTTIAGLPNIQFNVTIDGVTTGNMLQGTDGFFSMVTPRLDAVEEVTLVSSAAGVDASGQGAIQIRFATRSGTNKFETSVYEFMQHAMFNSNTYFNRLNGLPIPAATNHTFGARIGGPIILPGFDGRGRAFFFFNDEEVYSPRETPRTRTIIRQSALNGDFTYGTVDFTTRNVLALANASGIPGVNGNYDPTIKALLESIRTAAGTSGVISELTSAPNTASYDLLSPFKVVRHAPTASITLNLSPKHRLQGSYYWQRFVDTPDTLNNGDRQFPDFPVFGGTTSYRTTGSVSLRSTLSTGIVNEARGGWAWHPEDFFGNVTPEDYANQGGFNTSFGFNLSNAAGAGANNVTQRNTANYTASDQLNWLKGSHSMTFGADYTHLQNWSSNYNHVPSVNLGFTTTQDPADAIFSAANFPGSTTGDRNNAKALYALLTGRVSAVNGTARLNEAGDEYVYIGQLTTRSAQDDYSFFAQDTWRVKPTVTITGGLRYQYTLPLSPMSSVFTTITADDACGPSGQGAGPTADGSTDRFCNMFKPGQFGNPTIGAPVYILYTKDNKGYNTDLNNLGPVVGVSWRPNVQSGWLRTVLGDPEVATVNSGFTRSFVRARVDSFLNVYNGNPGQTVPANRSTATTAFPLVPAFAGDAAGWPILFSQKDRLGAPAYNHTPTFPLTTGTIAANGICTSCGSSFNFNPDIEVPWTDSWNVSFQRSLTKDTVFEVRYQGNRSYKAWTDENWNAFNTMQGADSGGAYRDFYNLNTGEGEFRSLQQNLHANVVAGRGPSMAYMGPGTGTVPVPIAFAHLNGAGDPNDQSKYIGGVWTSSTFTGALDPYFPNPSSFASNLYGTSFNATLVAPGISTRLFNNAITAGYPKNYWLLNPQLSEVSVTTNSSNRPLNHLVSLQVRRRLSAGLSASLSYTWQRNISGSLLDFHLPRLYLESSGVPHSIQALWSYEIPVGRGKKYGSNMDAWLDAVVGGWQFSGTARFQTQSFYLRNTVLVGMSIEDARKALGVIRFVTDPISGAVSVFNFPEDIYTNTRLAYNTDETYPGYYAPGTEPNGPQAMVGPNGEYRYFRPAGGPDCNFVKTGDCNIQELRFLGRWFGEMDFRLAKQFQLPGHARFEFSAEVFNATKAINFPNVINPGTSANTFRNQSTGNTAPQSGARTAQLVWRVTW
jgi:hypothetical protein